MGMSLSMYANMSLYVFINERKTNTSQEYSVMSSHQFLNVSKPNRCTAQ